VSQGGSLAELCCTYLWKKVEKHVQQKEQKPSQIPSDLFFFLLSGYMCFIAEHPAKTFREILVECAGTADSMQLLQPIQQKHLVQL